METGQLRFDGLAIDVRQGRFAGTFDIEFPNLSVSGGDVMFVVLARAKGASIDETASGDIKRVDKITVKQVALVPSKPRRAELAEEFGLELPPELELDWSSQVAASGDAVTVTAMNSEEFVFSPAPSWAEG